MASIEKRTREGGSTAYRVVWRENGHKRYETFSRQADATQFRGMVDAAGQHLPPGWIPGIGMTPDATGITVAEWCERSIAARTGITEGSRERYRALIVNHVADGIGQRALADVTREDAAQWLNGLRKYRRRATGVTERVLDTAPLSAKTVRNIHGLMSSVYSDAMVNGLAASNPFAGLKLPDDGPHAVEMQSLTRAEFATMLGLTPDHYKLFLRFLVETGTRWGEATALQVKHISGDTVSISQAWKYDANARLVLGPPKTRRGKRTITIPDGLASELLVSVAGKDPEAFVFTTPRGYVLRHAKFYERVWTPLQDKSAPIIGKRVRIHDLRHTHVAWLMEAGIDPYRIQQRLGHESIKTTIDRYGHLRPSADDDIKAALSGAASNVTPLLPKRTSAGR